MGGKIPSFLRKDNLYLCRGSEGTPTCAILSSMKTIANALKALKFVSDARTWVAAALALGAVCGASAVPKVIFDTDMYTDFDDVGALAVLHALADAGECEILGTVVSTRKSP